MKINTKRVVSVIITAVMLVVMLPSFAMGESGKKYTETLQPEGWTLVENEGGAILSYTKGGGVDLIEVDGYAFKDLDRDGELDVFEDWRVDYKERSRDLVTNGGLSLEFQLGLKMNPFSVGTPAKTLADTTKTALDLGYRHIRFSSVGAELITTWNNEIQKHIEANTDVVAIPATFIADPLEGSGVTDWPGNLALAATFDPELAHEYGRTLSKEWHSMNLTMNVGPQVDLATEPRWSRNDMTFGEDPQLSIDMTRAMINAWQSTYDDDGNDLGWGKDSVNIQVKHIMSEGAGEGGREAHSLDGAYAVYPGGQFYTSIMPYFAAQDLPGKTGTVSNEADLDFVLEIDELTGEIPLVLVMNLNSSMVWSEIEPSADAILVSFGGGRTHSARDEILFEIIAGNYEPSALLPMQQPLDMETVEAQYEDVPRDMDCYVDADGNTYDFTFGLNWSGVIDDERVAKYNVEPIVGTNPLE